MTNQNFYSPSQCGCKKPGCNFCFPVRKCFCQKPGCGLCFPQKSNMPYFNPFWFQGNTPVWCPPKGCCPPKICYPKKKIVTWRVKYLVSNRPNQASHFDIACINPWGIAIANNQLWVVTGENDGLLNYDLYGNKLLGTVRLRDAVHNVAYPTGIVINCTGSYSVSNGHITSSAMILTATESGHVVAYNPTINVLQGYVVIASDLNGEHHAYKGLALTKSFLYCADFFRQSIDVFDNNYNRQTGFPFQDMDTSNPIPADYGPNNIVHIGCYLYVLYARQDPLVPVHDLNGPGHGYISVYNLDGTFVRRFTSQGELNSPWAMIPAPYECGFPKDAFLVGNNGDGHINIYDCSGAYCGKLLNSAGLPVQIEGLWGLAPHYTCINEIYFAASDDENRHGVIGSMIVDQVISC